MVHDRMFILGSYDAFGELRFGARIARWRSAGSLVKLGHMADLSEKRARFRQADITKAIRALQAAGVQLGRIEIEPGGLITVFPADAPLARRGNSWDDFR